MKCSPTFQGQVGFDNNKGRKPMKLMLTKILALNLLWVLPVWANDVGLHNSSAQHPQIGNQ